MNYFLLAAIQLDLPAILLALFGGGGAAILVRMIDLHIAKKNQTKEQVEGSLERMSALDATLLQQRQQFDESTARFRMELQKQIDGLQAQVHSLLEENRILKIENITLTIRIKELEFNVSRLTPKEGSTD